MPSLRSLRPRRRAVTVVRAAALGVAATRFLRGITAEPALRADAGRGSRSGPVPVTVIVPARDEAGRIGPCLASLAGQAAEVVVIDDGSVDATAEVARRFGATVVAAGPLPAGWAGKAHALQVGLEHATTPTAVTVDADTRAEPGFVAAAAAALASSTLVTGGARLDATAPGERWLHPSMLSSLVYRLGPPGVRACRASRTAANGQCMVLDRARVLDAGGFGPVRGNLVEDLALARSLAARGHDVRFVDATAILTVDGYGSAAKAWRGWGRSLDLASVTPVRWQVVDLVVVWAAMALPLPRLAVGAGDAVDVAAVAVRIGTLIGMRRAYRHRGLAYWLSPLADVATAARITWGSVRPARVWRGRRY